MRLQETDQESVAARRKAGFVLEMRKDPLSAGLVGSQDEGDNDNEKRADEMPVERRLVEEAVVFDADRVDDAVDNSNDNKDAVLPVDAGAVVGVANVDDGGNELRQAEIS